MQHQPADTDPDTLRGEYAGFVTRSVALLCDIAILASIVLILSASAQAVLNFFLDQFTVSPGATALIKGLAARGMAVFSLLLPPLYTVLFWDLIGQTPGKMLLGVRVVRLDGSTPTLVQSAVRYVGYFASAFLLLGFLWVLVDNRRQAWHDKLARTLVVYTWDGAPDGSLRWRRAGRARARPSRRRSGRTV